MDATRPDTYVIRRQPLASQLADKPKLAFFVVLYGLILYMGHFGGIWHAAAIGALLGTFPSIWHGLATSMPVLGEADWARAEQWLERTGHRRQGAAWVPPLPRWLYFNTQIVRYADGRIHGPQILLKKLRQEIVSS